MIEEKGGEFAYSRSMSNIRSTDIYNPGTYAIYADKATTVVPTEQL